MDTGDSRVSDDAGSSVFKRVLLLHPDQIDWFGARSLCMACLVERCQAARVGDLVKRGPDFGELKLTFL